MGHETDRDSDVGRRRLGMSSAFAAETLVIGPSIAQPQTQRKILDRIFRIDCGRCPPPSEDKQNGTYFFPDNSTWMRSRDVVWDPRNRRDAFLS